MLSYVFAAFIALVSLASAQVTTTTTTTTNTNTYPTTTTVTPSSTYSATTAVVGSDGITTVPWPPPTCSALNTATYAVYDPYDYEEWYYMCGAGTNNPSLNTMITASSWRGCFQICENYAGCTGFSYAAGNNWGEGNGYCALKSGNPQGFSQTSSLIITRVGAIRARYGKYQVFCY